MADSTQRGITFYDHDEAPLLDDTDMMTPPEIDRAVYTELDLTVLQAGSVVKALFDEGRPGGCSLVHASFGPGYRLPRHSHSADCLYYVVRGEAIMGSRTIRAGDGFFVRSGQPYAYQAGPDGVEVLEFRTETQFDMQVLDQTVERWEPIVAAANDNQDRWLADAAAR
jgi:quercetin dioxygenase-like cupin family protein